jgi:hypothetical protein
VIVSSQAALRLRERKAAQIDDEEAIGGPYYRAVTEVSGPHEEAIRHPSVHLGNQGQRVLAGRSTALTTELGDETDPLAVQGAQRLTRAKPRRAGRASARSMNAPALTECHARCVNHVSSGDRN